MANSLEKDTLTIMVQNLPADYKKHKLQTLLEDCEGLVVKEITKCKSTSAMYATFKNVSMCKRAVSRFNNTKIDNLTPTIRVKIAAKNWRDGEIDPTLLRQPKNDGLGILGATAQITPGQLQAPGSSGIHSNTQEPRVGEPLHLPQPYLQQPMYHPQQYPGVYPAMGGAFPMPHPQQYPGYAPIGGSLRMPHQGFLPQPPLMDPRIQQHMLNIPNMQMQRWQPSMHQPFEGQLQNFPVEQLKNIQSMQQLASSSTGPVQQLKNIQSMQQLARWQPPIP